MEATLKFYLNYFITIIILIYFTNFFFYKKQYSIMRVQENGPSCVLEPPLPIDMPPNIS